jgi:hypothetical protein
VVHEKILKSEKIGNEHTAALKAARGVNDLSSFECGLRELKRSAERGNAMRPRLAAIE